MAKYSLCTFLISPMFDKKKLSDLTDKYLKRASQRPVSSLSHDEIAQCYASLIDILWYHNYLYYIASQPIVADGQYDQLYRYLLEIEETYPEIILPDSPSQRLTHQIQEGFNQAKHSTPLLSLENSYNAQDLAAWHESIGKIFAKSTINQWSYICQPKYDGVSIELIYENGQFAKAITRGDGVIGEDVTENIRTLQSVPMTLPAWHDCRHLRVRGEIVMSKKSLERVNAEKEANDEAVFANSRNAASGSIRQLDASVTAKRGLQCFVYDILSIDCSDIQFATYAEATNRLQRQWFFMHIWQKNCPTIDAVIDICDAVETKNYFDMQDIEFDGIVVKVAELHFHDILGETNHHPRRAMAYKFPTKQITTRISSIDFQVWRSWVLTPAANLDPVELWGVTIGRASLHNIDFIIDKDIRIGDYVWLQRSGEVIPYVVAAIPERRKIDEDGNDLTQPISAPTTCPICWGIVEKGKSDIYIYCTNDFCPAKIKGRIIYYVSRDSLNIEGIGESLIDVLIAQGLIHDVSDLYNRDDPQMKLAMVSLPGVGQKKYFEIAQEIQRSKQAPLRRLLNGLGIQHIGKKIAQIIVEAIATRLSDAQKEVFSAHDLEAMLSDQELLMEIKGIGPEIISSLQQRFADDTHRQLLERMESRGVVWHVFDTSSQIKGKLSGIRFCITGTFALPRKVIADILSKHGAIIADAVTQQTSFVLVGEDSSSKVTKATDYGIPLIEWLDRLEQKFDFLKHDIGSMKLFSTKEKKEEGKPVQSGLFG
jgi:DNA ligase (NAD+)